MNNHNPLEKSEDQSPQVDYSTPDLKVFGDVVDLTNGIDPGDTDLPIGMDYIDISGVIE